MKIKFDFNSPLVLVFSLLAVLVFIVNELAAHQLMPMFSLSGHFNFSSPIQYITLFTYVLGHGTLQHLMGNLMLVLLLGPVLEEKYGTQKLLLMIVATALVTAFFHILFFSTRVLGASGIVFMFIILVSFVNVRRGRIPVTFILILLLYIGQEVMNIFQQDNISQFGHIAGGLIGALFGFSGWMAPKQNGAGQENTPTPPDEDN